MIIGLTKPANTSEMEQVVDPFYSKVRIAFELNTCILRVCLDEAFTRIQGIELMPSYEEINHKMYVT